MPWGAAAVVGGALIASNASSRASRRQANSAREGLDETARQFDRVQELLKPYVDVGTEGLFNYRTLAGTRGAAPQNAAINVIARGPEFAHLTKQGENAILQNASATGGLRGGNVQAGLADFRSNLLSTLIDKQLSRYSGMAQMGQNSAAGVGSAALTTGQASSNLMQQAGAAQAGGMIAGGNAISNAMGTVGGIMAARGAQMPGFAGASGFGSGINPNSGEYIGSLEF